MTKQPQSDIFSEKEFSSLPIAPFLLQNLSSFSKMTKIQEIAIPPQLKGHSIAAKARTGSGKSLAFLIPAIDTLYRLAIKPHNGTGVLIITPTRELAIQLYETAKQLIGDKFAIGLCIGGTSKQKEAMQLQKGAALVIGTPGRLFDHLKNTRNFNVGNLFQIILDEADQLLDLGFEDELKRVFRLLPDKEYQISLFSATLNDSVFAILNNIQYNKQLFLKLDADGAETAESKIAMRSNFTQGYVICAPRLRFLLLYSFLKAKKSCKILVFASTCAAVQFYSEFLKFVGFEGLFALQGKMKQNERIQQLKAFEQAPSGVLVATNVVARGIDIPDVDYVIQFDPPESVQSYVHRSGRACRGSSTRKGVGILFIYEWEMPFVNLLVGSGVQMAKFEFGEKQVINISQEFKEVVGQNYYLLKSAQEAFKAYVSSYASMPLKQIFDLDKLDLDGVADSFGLCSAPQVAQIVKQWQARRKAELKKEKLDERKKKYEGREQCKEEISQSESSQSEEQGCKEEVPHNKTTESKVKQNCKKDEK